MNLYLLTIVAVSIILTTIGILSNKKFSLIVLVLLSVLVGWYFQIISTEFYNDLAWQEFKNGHRASEPSDGASNVFAIMFGWLPSLIISLILMGVHKLVKVIRKKTHNKQSQKRTVSPPQL